MNKDNFLSKNTLSRVIFRMQAIIWFGLAIAMLVLWLFLWMVSDTDKAKADRQKSHKPAREFVLPTYIESYVQMTKEVPPIDFSTVIRDLRNYPPEFKDKQYFEKHAKEWTVQVMNVSNNDIITQYLNGREDRDQFAYFRYHNANGELRYILTYGAMKSQEALQTITSKDFGLPPTVKLKAEEIGYYVKIMDYYERGEVIDDSDDAPRAVMLSVAQKPLTALPIKPSAMNNTQGGNGGSANNKFQHTTPHVPHAPNVGGTAGGSAPSVFAPNATTNAPVAPNAPKPTSTPASNAPKPKPPQEVANNNQEVVMDMAPPPKAPPAPPPPKPVAQESSSVTYGGQNEVTYEAPKQTARPNTNTASIPGAERD